MKAPEEGKLEHWQKAAGMITKNMADKTFFRGLHDLVELVYDPSKEGAILGSTLSGFVPFSSAVSTAARGMDTKDRAVRGTVEKMKSRIPGLRETLPPKVDIRGREKLLPGTGLERIASPMQRSVDTSDDVDKFLAQSGLEIGDPKRTITHDNEKIQLSTDEYSQLKKKSGELLNEMLDGIQQDLEGATREEVQEILEDLVKKSRAEARAEILDMILTKDEARLTKE